VLSADVCSVGSTSGAKISLPDKVLDGLEKVMLVHSEIVRKGLELDARFDTKVRQCCVIVLFAMSN